MANMTDYAKTEFRSFDDLSLTEVDSLIFTWLVYLNPETLMAQAQPSEEVMSSRLSGMTVRIRDLFKAEYFPDLFEHVKFPDLTQELLTAVCASPRFRDVEISHYEYYTDHDTSTQFAAMTFRLQEDLWYVAFRGTDDTLIGWKENFDLSLAEPVPSQTMAKAYVEKIQKATCGNLVVGGHSKGGNLAVYASATCAPDVREKIEQVFSHDGPGFQDIDLAHEGFKIIRHKICKTLPQSSMIGMTFTQECEYKIIKSNEKGIMQHNPFSWEVDGEELLHMKKHTKDASLVYKSVNEWMDSYDDEKRAAFITTLFDILDETGVESFEELGENIQKDLPIIARAIRDMDPETRKFMLKIIRDLAVTGAKNIPELL